MAKNTYPKLGDVLSRKVVPEGGCCPIGPSYACHNCGQDYAEATVKARKAKRFFAADGKEITLGFLIFGS